MERTEAQYLEVGAVLEHLRTRKRYKVVRAWHKGEMVQYPGYTEERPYSTYDIETVDTGRSSRRNEFRIASDFRKVDDD